MARFTGTRVQVAEEEEPIRGGRFGGTRVTTSAPADKPEKSDPSLIRQIQGAGTTLLSGQTSGFADEAIGNVRAMIDDILPETEADRIAATFNEPEAVPEKYLMNEYGTVEGINPEYAAYEKQKFNKSRDMYIDDARAAQQEFADANGKTALALEVVGGLANPLNKVAPGFAGGGGLVKSLGIVGRGAAEGALEGLGRGEGSLEERGGNAAEGAAWGGGVTAGLNSLGGLGKAIAKQRRNADDMFLQDAGEFVLNEAGEKIRVPLTQQKGKLGNLYRHTIGQIPFARGELIRQQDEVMDATKNIIKTKEAGISEAAAAAKTAKAVARDEAKEAAADARIADRLELDEITDSTIAQKARITDEGRASAQAFDDEAERLVQAAKTQGRQAAADIPAQARRELADQEASFYNRAVERSIPDGLTPKQLKEIREATTQKRQSDLIAKYSNERAFYGTKEIPGIKRIEQVGDLPPVLRSELADEVNSNPALREALEENEALYKKLEKAMTDGKGGLSGDDLMELRNVFARKANKPASLQGKAARSFAKKFDDLIKEELGGDGPAWKAYQKDLRQYGDRVALGNAVKKADNASRNMTPDDWVRAKKGTSEFREEGQILVKSGKAQKETVKQAKAEAKLKAQQAQEAAKKNAAAQKKAAANKTRENTAAATAQAKVLKKAKQAEQHAKRVAQGKATQAKADAAAAKVANQATEAAEGLKKTKAQKAEMSRLGISEKANNAGDLARAATGIGTAGAIAMNPVSWIPAAGVVGGARGLASGGGQDLITGNKAFQKWMREFGENATNKEIAEMLRLTTSRAAAGQATGE